MEIVNKIQIVKANKNTIFLTENQFNLIWKREIKTIYIPFFKDMDVKDKYINRNENEFTWEYQVLLYNGYKKKYDSRLFLYDFGNRLKAIIEREDEKNITKFIDYKSFDCIRSTHENGLDINKNWHWRIELWKIKST